MKGLLAAAPLVFVALGVITGCTGEAGGVAAGDAILADETDGANWPLYGRTFSANHFSPLEQVNDGNVDRLGLVWSLDLPTPGSLYTSPIAVNGVLYFAMGYSVIRAVDARTGKELWTYDPEVGKVAGPKLRGGWGIRGIAWWDGRIYTGTQDGRLIAIDAKTGKPVWSVQTTEGPDDGRYITGAPWVFRGKVVIGHGGADFAPVRGYVTAYDARTGKKLWRFYTVPGDPAKEPDGEASDNVMAMAAKTWKGEWWKFGGGGTVWNAMAYDPEFNRLYIGTGNGTPWNQKIRSPGGGDNLFLCSIVALDADTGEYVWHYQINPGETWDYNSVMDIELTDLEINGESRPVLIQAPKNGFFYVIDRETGKLLSAKPFVPVNWASRIDLKTGRPVENPEARYPDKRGTVVAPHPGGAHNAQPMSYSPKTRLAYIPTTEAAHFWSDEGIDLENWRPQGAFSLYDGVSYGSPETSLPPVKMYLLAWDPVTQTKVWSAPLPDKWGGGVMSTGGNLVFNGQSDGWIRAYNAKTGKPLWSFDARTGVSSEPITYLVDGKQYITVLAGYRGLTTVSSQWDYRTQPRRVLTFALDGKAELPPRQIHRKQFVDDKAFKIDPAKAALGERIAIKHRCVGCHGAGLYAGSMAPDLRESSVPLSQEAMYEVLRNGALQSAGMPGFPELTSDEIEAMRHFVRKAARDAIAGRSSEPPSILEQ